MCTSLQNCQVGGGGNDKGTDMILDFNTLGEDNSATLDIGTFLDRAAFRKSAGAAWDMSCNRVQEGPQVRILGDI